MPHGLVLLCSSLFWGVAPGECVPNALCNGQEEPFFLTRSTMSSLYSCP